MSTLQKLASSLALAFILEKYQPRYWPLGTVTGTVLIFLVQFVVLTLFDVLLYPRWFSPLRHIPEPPDGHFFTGQTRRVLREPSGVPMKDWVANVKNNGLVRYSVWGRQRVMPTTPSALGRQTVARFNRSQLIFGVGS